MSEYGDVIQQTFGQQRQAAQAQVVSSFDDEPDKAARAMELEKASGVPAPAIMPDVEGFERQHKAQLASEIIAKNPAMQDWLNQNPMHAKIAHDDLGNLDALTQSLHKLREATDWKGARSVLGAAAEGFMEGSEYPYGSWMYEPSFQSSVIGRFINANPTAKALAYTLYGAGVEVPSAIFGGAQEALARGVGTAAGQLGMDPAWGGAVAEMFGYHFMAHAHEGVVAPEAIPKVKELVDSAGPFVRGGKEPPVGLHPEIDKLKAEQAKADADSLDAALKDTQASALRERSPEALADYISSHGPQGSISIPAEAILRLYGEEEPTAEDGKLGWVQDLGPKLRAAASSGSDVDIPLAEWLAKVEPEVAKELHDDVRVRPGGMTLNEAKEIAEPHPAPPMDEVDAVRAGAAVRPLRTQLRLDESTTIEGVPAHKFTVLDPNGSEIGKLDIAEEKEGKTLYIDNVDAGGAGALGTRQIRDFALQLKRQFPKAEEIIGDHVGGSAQGKIRLDLTKLKDKDIAQFAEGLMATPKEGQPILPENAQPGEAVTGGEATVQSLAKFQLKDILPKLDTSHLTEEDRLVQNFMGAKLGELAGDTPVHVLTLDDFKKMYPGFRNASGVHDSGTIFLRQEVVDGTYPSSFATRVVWHEGYHAITADAIANSPEIRQRIRGLMDLTERYMEENLSRQDRKPHDYALTNEYEFMAEGGAKADLKNLMGEIPLSPEEAEAFGLRDKANPTIWDAFRGLVKQLWERVFGKAPDDTVLDAFFKVLSEIEQVNKKLEEMDRQMGLAHPADQPELPGTRRLEDTPAFAKGALRDIMPEAQRARYDRLISKQWDEDLERQMSRATADAKRRLSKEWKAKESELRPQVTSDIRSRPDVAADDFFRTGRYGDEHIKGGAKLDATKLTAEQRASIPERYYKEKGGLNPDDAAGLFGYQTGAQLVDRLAALEQQRQASGKVGEAFVKGLIEDEVDRRVEKELGNFGEKVLEDAQDHVISPTQIDILHEQTVALGMKAGGAIAIAKEDLRAQAKGAFAEMSVRGADKDRFLADAGRAGRAAEEALLKGKYDEAFRAKQQQLFSFLYANEAKKLDKERGRFETNAKRMAKREVTGVQQHYTNFIHQILLAVEMPVRRSIQDLQDAIGKSGFTDLKDFVESKEADLREVPVADFLYDPKFHKPYESLTTAEFMDVSSSIKALIKNGRDELSVERAGEKRDLAAVVGEMVGQLEKLPEKKVDVTVSARKGIGHTIRTAWASLLQVEAIFNRWDRGDPKGVFTQYIMRPLAEASNSKAAMERKFARRLKGLKDNVDLNERVPNTLFKSPLNDEPMTFSRKNLRAILQNVGNESNLDKLARGYAVDPVAIMDWLNQNAKKEDWDWAQKQGKIFADLKRESDRMYRRLTDSAPEDIETRPIQTPHGTYDGWYHPAVYDPRFPGTSKRLMGNVLEEDNYVRATTPSGYTKKRTGYAAPISLDLDETPNRMRGIIHDISFREAVIQASKIFYHKDIQRAVMKHYGQVYKDMLVPYLRDVANQANFRSDAQAVGARVSEFMRQNIIGTLIGWNPGTVMKHFQTAAVNSLTEVGPVNFLRATKDLLQTNDATGERNWSFAMGTSEELQRRHRNYVETLGGAQQEVLGKTSLRDFLLKAAATPVAISDLLSAVPTWLAQYRKSMESGADHGTSIFEADRAVRRAHGSAALTNRPAAMRGGQMAQWLTSLYGFFSHMLNRQFEMMWMASDSFKGLQKGDFSEAKAHLPQIAIGFFSYIILPALIEEAVTPMTNEEHESWAAWSAKTLAKGVSSSWPIIRDLADFGLSQGRREPSVGLFSSSAKAVSDAMRDVSVPSKAFSKQHAGQTIQHGLTAFGAVSGLTNAQEGKVSRFIYDYATGQEHPKGASGWWRGLRYGTSKERR